MFKTLKPKLFLRSLSGQFTITNILSSFTILLIILIGTYIFAYINGIMIVKHEVKNLEKNLASYAQTYKNQDNLKTITAMKSTIDFIGATSNNNLILTDPEGLIIDSSKKDFETNSSLFDNLTLNEQVSLKTALSGQSTYTNVSLKRFNLFDSLIIATPIINVQNEILGVIVIWLKPISIRAFAFDFLTSFVSTLAIFSLLAIPLIISISRKQGRNFANRLEQLACIAGNWAKGDLSQIIIDTNQDELGKLSQDFNAMAKQFNTLLENKQELATVKERNRLAIELHDSVKQQIFAIGLKVATIEKQVFNPKSKNELNQIQKMVQNIKEELNRVILELKPLELEHSQFITALQHYATTWSQNYNIVVQINQKGKTKLPYEYEQSFFRVSQEALTNVLKHSSANFVEIDIDFRKGYKLSIKDNGQGFERDKIETNGIGLKVMQERIEKLGGKFQIASSAAGTLIQVSCFQNQNESSPVIL